MRSGASLRGGPARLCARRAPRPYRRAGYSDRDGNGIADLLLAEDRTMAGQQCGAARVAHDDPTGWDGVRVFTVSDDPANPSPTSSRWRPCTRTAAPTITLYPSLADEGKLIVYVSSYPLRPGPTCGQVNGPPAGNDPLHKKISVIEVPLADPAAAHVIAQPPISYPR